MPPEFVPVIVVPDLMVALARVPPARLNVPVPRFWTVPLTVSDHDEAVEQEPNDDAKKANRIAVPGGMSGRFQRSDDVDFFVFSAKKGQKLAIEAHTLEAYSPTLVYMVLRNAKTNAEIAKTNPQTPPPGDQRIDFTAAE